MIYPLDYIRTDRNGTKIYHDWNCTRCGGAGQSSKWAFTGKRCWGCGGSGRAASPKVVKEYTPEYQAKLDARKAAREAMRLEENPPPTQEELEAAADQARRANWVHQGFREDGVGYVHAGSTYANKDALKAAGGRWTYALRAYIAPSPIEGLKGVRITEVRAQDLCNIYGNIDWEKTTDLEF